MANKATQALKTGMAVLGGADIPVFTLEHLSSTSKHSAGSYEKIVIPFIELGRDSSCAVRFGDDSPTVSRRHASIERNGKDVILKNLSQTNTTLVNGKAIGAQYFLNNGDEIQLSNDGPKIRFNTSPTGTAKMGFTNRMNLVMQQAIRPYKTAVIGITAVFVIILAFGAFMLYKMSGQVEEQKKLTDEQTKKVREMEKNDSINRIKLREELEANKKKYFDEIASLKKQNQNLQASIAGVNRKVNEAKPNYSNQENVQGSTTTKEAYQQLKNNVYFIKVMKFTVKQPDGKEFDIDYAWMGTGFMLNDGKFVTARHCIQGWRFITSAGTDQTTLTLNAYEYMGYKYTVLFEAVSPTDKFTFTNHDVTLNDKNDKVYTDEIEGETYQFIVAEIDHNDWAYVQTSNKTNLVYDQPLSKNLKAGEQVMVMGYSYGLGGDDNPNNVSPLLSESLVAQDGLNSAGSISLTNRNFGQGNSGGPVLTKVGNEYKVIGIVSAGMGAEIGFIVPIAELK